MRHYSEGLMWSSSSAVTERGPFFEGELPELDGFLMPAESGAAWSLIHLEYTVVVTADPVGAACGLRCGA